MKSKRKFKALNEVDVGNGVIDTNVKYSSCGEVEALGYFHLSGMIYIMIEMRLTKELVQQSYNFS